MNTRIEGIRIAGIQAVAPSEIVDNMKYAGVLGARYCKRQIQLTGVKQRHVSPAGQNSADLAYAAGKELIERLNWNPQEIDVLIFATQNPVFAAPSTAFLLQQRLGIKQECTVFDFNMGCPAAIIGIEVVASLLKCAGDGAKGLLLLSDPVYDLDESETITPNDLLFGSAGAAVALQYGEKSACEIVLNNKSDGSRYQAIFKDWGERFGMDGEKVFSFAIHDVAEDAKAFLSAEEIDSTDIDYYIFHQAQALILSALDEECGIPPERELRSVDEYGNTRGASIFVTLCKHAEKLREQEQIKVFLCAFGGGLAWGNMIAKIQTDTIFPLVTLD